MVGKVEHLRLKINYNNNEYKFKYKIGANKSPSPRTSKNETKIRIIKTIKNKKKVNPKMAGKVHSKRTLLWVGT